MTILGRGSMRDKKKEEELRESGDPAHSHLNDDLHILVEVNGPFNQYKLLAGVAEVRKMLIPNVSSIFLSNYPLTSHGHGHIHKCVRGLHKSIRIYMGVLILGINTL